MDHLIRFKFFLWKFIHFKVPLIGYLKPRLVSINDSEIIVRLPLNRRSRNHLNSMYFGALAVGADLAGGFHGFYHSMQKGYKLALVFKSFTAHFLRRPESDVYFICSQGTQISDMIDEAKKTGNRITQPILIKAYTDYPNLNNEVANFTLELSIRVIK